MSLKLLRCPVQFYHWGKTGRNSLVARLGQSGGHLEAQDVNDETHYAELWMGTHPSKPSYIQGSENKLLKEELCEDLSFLFKILSIETALSIQAHPDKENAVKLRAKEPTIYPDSNHKPEIAVALTPFEALCSFRPLSDIEKFVNGVPELRSLLQTSIVKTKDDLKTVFSQLMNASQSEIEKNFHSLMGRLQETRDVHGIIDEPLRSVLIRVGNQYPGDIGLFSMFFLNYITLEIGEALFLAANEPHAYLSGDCVECMATSDNVVRAGLTPKYKDVTTLLNMLTYESSDNVKFRPNGLRANVDCFQPPVSDFGLLRYEFKGGENDLVKVNSHSVLIVICGKGIISSPGNSQILDVREGNVVIIPKNADVKSDGELLMFQAFTPL